VGVILAAAEDDAVADNGGMVMKIVVVDELSSPVSALVVGPTVTKSVVVNVTSVDEEVTSVFAEVVTVTVTDSVTVTGSHVTVISCSDLAVLLAKAESDATEDEAGTSTFPSVSEAVPSNMKV
jgi:hypothetical protein